MPTRHWSPDPELHNGAHAKTYRHDPYRAHGKVFFYDDEDVSPAPATAPPAGTRHPTLWGRVSFVPYPTGEFRAPSPPPEDAELVRVFVGQLPYFVTDMQLSWLCHTFGGGSAVVYPERIMKKQPNGERLPTGCIHAYVVAADVDALILGVNKRMLVDDTGVWHAQTHDECESLKEYVSVLHQDRNLRVPGRPYDSVVVQQATSTFGAAAGKRRTNSEDSSRHPAAERRSAADSPTPPSYSAPPAYPGTISPPPPYHGMY